MNNLIVFDIDGTLIHYLECEDQAYLQALTSVTGIQKINTEWHTYQYSTDSGILSEIIQYAFSRQPTTSEILSIKNEFVSYLANYFKLYPQACRELPGAKNIFKAIQAIHWDVAIATGGWQESALMKLEKAKLPCQHLPLAHGDDHYDRKDIIKTAVSRAEAFYNKKSYQNIIYVGDALWDLKASRELQIKFIGVGKRFDAVAQKDFFRIEHYETNNLLDYLTAF